MGSVIFAVVALIALGATYFVIHLNSSQPSPSATPSSNPLGTGVIVRTVAMTSVANISRAQPLSTFPLGTTEVDVYLRYQTAPANAEVTLTLTEPSAGQQTALAAPSKTVVLSPVNPAVGYGETLVPITTTADATLTPLPFPPGTYGVTATINGQTIVPIVTFNVSATPSPTPSAAATR